MTHIDRQQSTDRVLLVRPVAFRSNPETAETNSFQDHAAAPSPEDAQADALPEFEGLVAALRAAGINVVVADDRREPPTPDSVFPNNWLSTHSDGTVVTYPMCAVSRRGERRADIVAALSEQHGFEVRAVWDLSGHEAEDRFLEGTGSLVLDRVAGVAYACTSARTDADLVRRFCELSGYDAVVFRAVDAKGTEIYHTNVLMCVGTSFATICLDAIPDAGERAAVRRRLEATGHEVVEISLAQMTCYAGNMLELRSVDGRTLIAMSRRAHGSLDPGQLEVLARHGEVIAVDIDTIEDCAGGSVRCMIAELHLPHHGEGRT